MPMIDPAAYADSDVSALAWEIVPSLAGTDRNTVDNIERMLQVIDDRLTSLEDDLETAEANLDEYRHANDELRDQLQEATYTAALTRRQQEDLEEYTYQLRQAGSHPAIETILTHLLAHAPVRD